MATPAARRKTPRIIEVREKLTFKQWLTRTLKTTVALVGIAAFLRNWGWRALVAIASLAATAVVAGISI